MKKYILILAVAGLLSCKKTHTCKCDSYYTSGAPAPLTNKYVGTSTETIKDTRSNARRTCEVKSVPDNGSNIYSNCTLSN